MKKNGIYPSDLKGLMLCLLEYFLGHNDLLPGAWLYADVEAHGHDLRYGWCHLSLHRL